MMSTTATSSEGNQTVVDHLCEIRKKSDRDLDEDDRKLKAATHYDVRHYDTVVDIPALIKTIRKLDPTCSISN